MDPYAGHNMYPTGAHLQNQPQIVTNHYGSLNYPRNRAGYVGATYDTTYNGSSDPEWQYPASHTLKPSTDGRYNHTAYTNVPNYLSGDGRVNSPPNTYIQQHPYPANIHNNSNYYQQHHQNSPNRLPLNIANTYSNGGVVTSLNHPDVAVNGPPVNSLTINNTNYLGNHAVASSNPSGDGQHAVVRQLQEKFSGGRPNGEAGGDVTADENYGCEPDSTLRNNRGHNHIASSAGGGDGNLANHANHSQNHPTNNSSNGGGGGTGLNGVIPALCCASEKDVLDQNATEERSEDENLLCLRSLWVHCRLSVLLVLVVILLILFLSFSGALLYFKIENSRTEGYLTDEEPCEQANCALGESCFMESGRATCRCPESCSSSYAPVCGNDGVTYSNECLLRMHACQNRNSVLMKHPGECSMPDPCADKACLFGSRCVASADGHYATCECPTSCPNYGDSDDSQPVCGSNGANYRNKCELDREACRLGRNITIRYEGKCDPCEDILCTTPQVCHLDDGRRPVCRCSEACTMDFNPVCGSDGNTYSNECVMRQEGCRSRRDLRIIYRGKCSSGVNPCESRVCQGYETCAINCFGIAQCTCATVCDPIIRPVCGTDNRTYDNQCELNLSACREGKNVSVSYMGTCGKKTLVMASLLYQAIIKLF